MLCRSGVFGDGKLLVLACALTEGGRARGLEIAGRLDGVSPRRGRPGCRVPRTGSGSHFVPFRTSFLVLRWSCEPLYRRQRNGLLEGASLPPHRLLLVPYALCGAGPGFTGIPPPFLPLPPLALTFSTESSPPPPPPNPHPGVRPSFRVNQDSIKASFWPVRAS